MPVLVPLVVAIPFLFTAWVVHRSLEHRAQMRMLQQGTPRQVALPPSEREALEQRIANLEAIICSDEHAYSRALHERGAA